MATASMPSVLFVGMDRAFVEAFRRDFTTVTALSVAHSAAARERIPITRPLVVVVASSIAKAELQDIVDVCHEIRAELIRMPGGVVSPISYFRIKKALIERLEHPHR